MNIKMWPTAKVKPYDRNPRKNADAVAKVAASLTEFGWQQPLVVDADGVLIVGPTRLAAAKSLGIGQVPVLVADKLTPDQVKAYRLADNRTGEEATWDKALLALELNSLQLAEYDLKLTGFDDDELAKLQMGEDQLSGEERIGEALQHQVVVECASEEDQAELMQQLRDEGRECRPLTL